MGGSSDAPVCVAASRTPLWECALSMIESLYSLQTIGAMEFVLRARSSAKVLMPARRARLALTSVSSWPLTA
jgi:hypothetical protein